MRIVFYLGPAFEKWDPETVARFGAGGSEIMAIEITKRLAAAGHEVTVFADCAATGTHDEVQWLPHLAFSARLPELKADVLVAWRTPWILDKEIVAHAKAVVFAAHDSHYGKSLTHEQSMLVDKFVLVSEWHKQFFGSYYSFLPREKLIVIHNGIDEELMEKTGGLGLERGHRLIHTSSPGRSLDFALRSMLKIREQVPDAELHVFHGFLTPLAFAQERKDMELLAELKRLQLMLREYERHGVVYHDRAPQSVLYAHLLRSKVWVYPTHVAETFCLAAVEAQAAGCEIVATALGALYEVTKDSGLLEWPLDQEKYVDAVVQRLRRDREQGRMAFPISQTVRRYEALLGELVADSETRGSSPEVVFKPTTGPRVRNGKICLAMIVKDESAIIEQTLESAKPYVDHWCIIDTGSSDNTPELCRTVLGDKPGSVRGRPWHNFGYNRSELLTIAREENCEWLLLLDADCVLAEAPPIDELRNQARKRGADQYMADGFMGNLRYDKIFMLRASLPWYYEPPTHEWIQCDEAMTFSRMPGIRLNEHGVSARRKSGRKNAEDIEVLSKYIENKKARFRPRALFYLAQSQRDIGNAAAAIKAYRERGEIQDGTEEQFIAKLEKARLLQNGDFPEAEVIEAFREAWRTRPSRAEAPHAAAFYLRVRGKHAEAEEFARAAAAIPSTSDVLFVEYEVYSWRAKLELATILSWLPEKRVEAIHVYDEVADAVPATEKHLVVGGRKLCVELTGYVEENDDMEWLVVSPSSAKDGAVRALDDVADMLLYGLLDMGLRARRATECDPTKQNIFVGAHLHGATGKITDDTIIYQTEAWCSGWWQSGEFKKAIQAHEVWDYSEENAKHYEGLLGARRPKIVPLGYSPRLETVNLAEANGVGSIGSTNQRREAVLHALRVKDLPVNEIYAFGVERDVLLGKQALVVAPHYYARAPLAQSRLTYLLSNRIPVVAEIPEGTGDEWIKSCLMTLVHYDHLASECAILYGDKTLRATVGDYGYEAIKKYTMSEFIRRALVGRARPVDDTPRVRLNLGCADKHEAGYISVDRVLPAGPAPEGHEYLQCDLAEGPWPWTDSSVDEIRAHDFIEHLSDKIRTMNEAYRVLKPGGTFDIVVPTTDGRGAFQDPTHVAFWNRNSFWYFTDGDPHRERFGDSYGIQARFRVKREREWRADHGDISFLHIVLEAVKPAFDEERYGSGPTGPGGLVAFAAQGPEGAQAEPEPESAASKGPEGAVGRTGARPLIVGMMCVKNEERWIERAIGSLLPICDRVFVFDDHSTDRTREIVEAYPSSVELVHSPFPKGEFQEARDKNYLLNHVRDAVAGYHTPNLPLWDRQSVYVIHIDGDEEIAAPGKLRAFLHQATANAYSPRIRYLWNDESNSRIDGVYRGFRRASIFRLVAGTRYESSSSSKGDLHTGNCPAAFRETAAPVPFEIKHYGYMLREDRIKKYVRYNEIDPNNDTEDRYRHIIQGDGPRCEGDPSVITFPGEYEKLMHAGPLRFWPADVGLP